MNVVPFRSRKPLVWTTLDPLGKPHLFRHGGLWYVRQELTAAKNDNRLAMIFAHKLNGWRA